MILPRGLRTEIQRILLLAVFFGAAGYFNGYMTYTLIVGGGLYMLWTLTRIQRLYHWLDKGGRDYPPHSTGVWGDISDQLYRLIQRNRRNRHNHQILISRIRKITSALNEGVVTLNAERCLDWWNPAAGELLGLRREDRGEVFTNLLRQPAFVNFLQHPPYDEPLELTPSINDPRILQFTASHFGDDEIVLVVQDITRLRNLEEMRKEFVSNISHELRTPLTVLTGYIETLSDSAEGVPPHWQKALLQMQEQTQRLNMLTEDLGMLSQLESTTTMASSDKVILEPLLTSIVSSAEALSRGQHEIRCECPPELAVNGSARELHSAFSNIIYNAIKHNPEGCDIQIKAFHNRDSVNISIHDKGVGIDPIHLPRLTERFYRVEGSRATSSGGTGLGLAIVKHVLARNGGELKIDSTLGKGSTFTCIFKVAA